MFETAQKDNSDVSWLDLITAAWSSDEALGGVAAALSRKVAYGSGQVFAMDADMYHVFSDATQGTIVLDLHTLSQTPSTASSLGPPAIYGIRSSLALLSILWPKVLCAAPGHI